jgi:hypothetical protein
MIHLEIVAVAKNTFLQGAAIDKKQKMMAGKFKNKID